MKKIAIITDTSVYLDDKFKNENKNVKVLALPIILNGSKIIYNDEDISLSELKKLVNEGKAKTSQTSLGFMEQNWNEFLKEYDMLIVMGISKHLSTMYSNTVKLSQEKKFSNKVYVVDTEAVSVLLKKQIDFVLECIKKESINNFNNIKMIEKGIKKLKKTYKCLIFPKNLDALKAGGRITKAAASMANLLKIYPILIIKKGKIDKYGITNNYMKGIIKQITYAVKNYHINEIEILIADFDDPKILEDFQNELKKFNFKKITYIKLPYVILVHLGFNSLGFNYWIE